ncbi:hypothetical protein [Luteimonas lutimaris]|uniref:Uncharacterized protein n=1 Tax=Luteimonas lutimaris TaxID=698645 RepID=A0ABP7MKJ9_9GAMM
MTRSEANKQKHARDRFHESAQRALALGVGPWELAAMIGTAWQDTTPRRSWREVHSACMADDRPEGHQMTPEETEVYTAVCLGDYLGAGTEEMLALFRAFRAGVRPVIWMPDEERSGGVDGSPFTGHDVERIARSAYQRIQGRMLTLSEVERIAADETGFELCEASAAA